MSYIEDNIITDCRFCIPPDKDRIIYETDNFYIMLSLGAFVEGYLLINSKTHHDCCAAIDERLAHEFDTLFHYTQNTLREVYGACLCYEHGRAGACLQFSEANQHCYHAHMHCVPLSTQISTDIDAVFTRTTLHSIEDLREQYYLNPKPYLFVDDGQMSMYYINKPIRKQYLRHLASNGIGLQNEWNWLAHPNYENITRGKNKLKNYF